MLNCKHEVKASHLPHCNKKYCGFVVCRVLCGLTKSEIKKVKRENENLKDTVDVMCSRVADVNVFLV